MALRWRETGALVCAAKTEERAEDTYIDDRLHYHLSACWGIIRPAPDEEETGHWYWADHPGGIDALIRERE